MRVVECRTFKPPPDIGPLTGNLSSRISAPRTVLNPVPNITLKTCANRQLTIIILILTLNFNLNVKRNDNTNFICPTLTPNTNPNNSNHNPINNPNRNPKR